MIKTIIYLKIAAISCISFYGIWDWYLKGVGPTIYHILSILLLVYGIYQFFREMKKVKIER
jgi:hypothetical protein